MAALSPKKKSQTRRKTTKTDDAVVRLDSMTPSAIVEELDSHIVGQKQAKRSVAIALRNRARRKMLPEEMKEDIIPKNILMIGPTGVGKTEIARRMAKLAGAPFVKVEATKFTEVGYIGRDVESMVRELVAVGINLVETEMMEELQESVEKEVEDELIKKLSPKSRVADPEERLRRKEKLIADLRSSKLENRKVTIVVTENSTQIELPGGMFSDVDAELQNLFNTLMPRETEKKVTVSEARKYLADEVYDRLIDKDVLHREAIKRVEEMGIIFIDEIDKIVSKSSGGAGPDVAREGVQRDLLPIIEGSRINTRYGTVRTDYILFVGAGSFHTSKPSDLIPELQGRFPIRVELDALTVDDLRRILVQPKYALVNQYTALLLTEGVTLTFEEDALDEIAMIAEEVNSKTENIGARRLHTIMEKLLEEISFNAPELKHKKINVNKKLVQERLHDVVKDRDLSHYIL